MFHAQEHFAFRVMPISTSDSYTTSYIPGLNTVIFRNDERDYFHAEANVRSTRQVVRTLQ
jgi:hypothetical protein